MVGTQIRSNDTEYKPVVIFDDDFHKGFTFQLEKYNIDHLVINTTGCLTYCIVAGCRRKDVSRDRFKH